MDIVSHSGLAVYTVSIFHVDGGMDAPQFEEDTPGNTEKDEDSVDDDDAFTGDLDEIRSRQKLNSVTTISSLRVKPFAYSRIDIPLCRMQPMPIVRPMMQCDLSKLEEEFSHGYREGASVFYVSITDEGGRTREVSAADKARWGPIWNKKNDQFNDFLLSIPELAGYADLMFFVCDGNHRCQAWLNHIERLHKADESWHYLVDSILLDTKGRIGLVMQVMHNINK